MPCASPCGDRFLFFTENIACRAFQADVKMVGMGRSVAGKFTSSLGKYGCVKAMCVGDTTNLRELAIEVQVCFSVR